ncbi:MAG: chloride channel protein [Firmicutes bacterium]|nr:chloride channel protein [Bacillota bacterium]MCM1401545.1 chloride channel protein [Bacteroides sp.]MCM1476591.1 chloride channel protein [Bacteroides sp.]
MKSAPRQSESSGGSGVWHKFHIGEHAFLFIVSSLVGVCTGVMAWLLKSAINHLSAWFTATVKAQGPDWWLLLLPVTGVLIVVALRQYFFPGPIGHGVRVISRMIKKRETDLPAQVSYSPLICTALTLGFGGSAGAEGPIAFSGAALASTVSRRLGITGRSAMIMLGCGAGAGIAAIFKAPIGGALFTLEVLRLGMGSFGVMVLFVTTLIAALTATLLGGFSLDMVMSQTASYDPHILPWALLLGLFCGVYSIYYSYIMKLVEHWLEIMKNRWVRGAVSGVLVGCFLVLFPSLYGEGYPVMGHLLNGDFNALTFGTFLDHLTLSPKLVLLVATCVMLVKCFVTSLSYNGGGVTGEFAPTLFAGCFAGYVFAASCNLWLGTHLPVSQFVLLGMAGVMSGAIRAPLMAMFIVVEMSSAFTLLLPLAFTASLSFGVVRLFTSDSFFARAMDRNNGWFAKYLKKKL